MSKIRICNFQSAAAGGICILATLAVCGTSASDSIHTDDLMRVAILLVCVLASWKVLERFTRLEQKIEDLEQERIEHAADRELIVAKAIRATLIATGHELERPEAPVLKLRR